MKNKKILITSHTANFSKFNRSLMQRLKKEGYIVHYASAGEEPVYDCDKHFTIPFERSPLKINNIKAIRELKKIVEENEYDIIHTHTPMGSVITRLATKNFRKLNKTKVIYTAHGFHFYKGAPLLNWLIFYPVEKIMSKLTDILIVINQEDYLIAKNKFHASKVYKINGVGINLEKFKPATKSEKTNLRKKYGFKNDDIILIYAAEYNNNKNQSTLIDLLDTQIKKSPNIKLLLCGEGKNRDKFTAQIKKLSLGNNIQLMGYVDNMNELYKLSDICVSTSKREGLGLHLIEAMATGLPIVASDNRGHREAVDNDINGFLFKSNNKTSFTEYLKTIMCNDDLKNDISKKNIYESKKYDHENINNKIMKIYDNKNDQISISVIVPAYNCEDTIAAALKSVISQSDTKHIKEIIVVNDGSKDRTEDVIKDLINSNNNKINIKLISQKNSGVSKARNIAIQKSKGNWIAFLDADDRWNNNKIQEQITCIKKYNNINFISTNSNKITGSQGKLIEKGLRKISVFDFLFKSRISTPTVIVKKESLIETGLFDESKKYAEDQDLFMKLAFKFGIYHVEKNLVTLNDKPVFGHSGLSGNLSAMHLSCKDNINKAYELEYINKFEHLILVNFENIKYTRRVFISRSAK